ncbi:MAG: ABC transporter ATP-binding protein, partial [Actinomycetes bacterium]
MSPRKKDSTSIQETPGRAAAGSPAEDAEVLQDDDFVEEEYTPSEADGDMFGGMPAKKAEHFWPSAKRLMGLLKPEALGIYVVVAMVVVAVVLNVIAPKILGQAMDVIFAGVVGKQLPPDVSKEQFVDGLRQQGQDNFADMVARMDLVPGT